MVFPAGGPTPQRVIEMWDYRYSSTSGSVCAVPAPCVLGSVSILGGTLGTLTIYDNTAASGTVIGAITAPSGGQVFWFNARTKVGLSIQAAAATNFVVTYAL
ncbi:MAG: hypothetical protein NUV51_10025 [Sulfuricaulis sp.]|nr:hypothetical protein [Sulfuricaulis sp.]